MQNITNEYLEKLLKRCYEYNDLVSILINQASIEITQCNHARFMRIHLIIQKASRRQSQLGAKYDVIEGKYHV